MWKKIQDENFEGGKFAQFELTVGNELEGKFMGEKEIPKKEGGKFSIFIVENEAGEEVSLIKHTVLINKLKGVKIGDKVKITYTGVPEGKSWKNYEVDVWEEDDSEEVVQ